MRIHTGRGLGDFYYSVFRNIKANGVKVTPRGQKCIELPEPVTFVYTKPGACWMHIPGRKFNPFFALAEVVWILSGRGDIDWIAKYNEKMRDFNDGGPENHGAYGLRIRKAQTIQGPLDQIQYVVSKLKQDPYSRQAVISLWDPFLDNCFLSKDIPCNNLIYYSLRETQEAFSKVPFLDQTVVMRSNDLVWGTPYNAVQFTHLHALVAGMLGAEMGKFTYVIQNLHFYEDLYPETLAAIQEAAAYIHNPTAKEVPGFGPVTQEEFDYTKQLICSPERPGYWSFTIPHMLWIWEAIRNGLTCNGRGEQIAQEIMKLPSTLQTLVYGFYRDSKNEFTRDVIRRYKALSSPTRGV